MNNPQQKPENSHPAQSEEPLYEDTSPHAESIQGKSIPPLMENPNTEALRTLIEKTSADALQLDDELEIGQHNDTLVNAASEWIVSQGYAAPEIIDVEFLGGLYHKVLALGTETNDYLSELARDCALRGQKLVYYPFKLMESDSTVASYDSIHHFHCLSHDNLITGRQDESWVHERSHGIMDSLLVAGVDHVLHGIFAANENSPNYKLLYGDLCSFDEVLAHKEELSYLFSELVKNEEGLDLEILENIAKCSLNGVFVTKVLFDGVVKRVRDCLENLNALKDSPIAILKTTTIDGTKSRLEIGTKENGPFLKGYIDLKDVKDFLVVKLYDHGKNGDISFHLADPKWRQIRRELWQEATDNKFNVSRTLEHPHFTSILEEVRGRCSKMEALVTNCSKHFISICSSARGILAEHASGGMGHPKMLLDIALKVKMLAKALPCPDGIHPKEIREL